MDIQNLVDVQKSLFMKFAWKLLFDNLCWANLFKAKYVGEKHPATLSNSTRSRFLKGIMFVMPIMLKISIIMIKMVNTIFGLTIG